MRDGEPRRIRTGLEVCIGADLTAGRSTTPKRTTSAVKGGEKRGEHQSISPDRDAEMSLGRRYIRAPKPSHAVNKLAARIHRLSEIEPMPKSAGVLTAAN